ncbi:hypothetical protein [Streptomyces sp. NBC_01244]|uniref:hypothetical protein n=1 Tax=Streptomyces sp. NBC_01244 TaxID=2903797 RepID=UPI002E0F696C|nr:hypothetical protein OG247_23440 [Streptomyces sp. NBC_01244]
MASTPEKATDPDQTPALWDAETEALIAESAAQVEKGLVLGIELRNLGREVSHAQLKMRIRTPHPKTGLPDLLASGGPAQRQAREIYDRVEKKISPEDEERFASLDSLKKAAYNRNSDVLVEWLRAFDTSEGDDALELARDVFPGVATRYEKAKAKAKDGQAPSLTEEIYKEYTKAGVTLPRKGKTELDREYRERKVLQAAGNKLSDEQEARLTPLARVTSYFDSMSHELTKTEKNVGALTAAQKRKAKARLGEIAEEAQRLADSL